MDYAERKRVLIEQFSEYYFAHLKPIFQPWRFLEALLSKCEEPPLQCQADMLDSVSSDRHRSARYPVSSAHQRSVGLWMSELCRQQEEHGWPLHAGFEAMAQMPDCEPDYSFKTYRLPSSSDLVLLEENRQPNSHGTTGLISWQAAAMLCAWAESFGASVLAGKDVVELGSGLGLFGISLAMSGLAKSVTLTDCHHKVLNFLRINAALNLPDMNIPNMPCNYADWTTSPPFVTDDVAGLESDGSLTIRHLDWTNFQETDLPPCASSSDGVVVVGSDLVYSPDLVLPLAKIIKSLLKGKPRESSSQSQPSRVAYIACTHRNGPLIAQFLQALVAEGLRYEVFMRRTFSPDDGIMVHHEPLAQVSLFKIQCCDQQLS